MSMSMLVLGGSHFLGLQVAEQARDHGWQVSVFNRGKTGSNPDGVRGVVGDRMNDSDLARLVELGAWDAVVDTSGMNAEAVESATAALAPVVGRYVYVSTVSVYADWPLHPLREELPTLTEAAPAHGMPPDVNVSYGRDKAACEQAARTHLDKRLTILRPGVILGPGEYVGRLPWWLARTARGGQILAPGCPDQALQPVDVRDLAVFACRRAETATGGEVFNIAAPQDAATMGGFLADCLSATEPARAELTWVNSSFLVEHEVRQWTELPLWRTHSGTWQVDAGRAREAGLLCRPLEQTVADTWSWMQAGNKAVYNDRAALHGIDPAKEQAVLAAWATRRERP
ncbi:NAD-dependent epimerase/dehydratase family protein [Streptomyces sp. NPDC048441]|uniref:NAD-dependent epimerase/dehydratase family protein n=1 Tax=Streptomyces sp. NPDC048441 TaxID=3365552 RepID=UPI0037167214